jgi:hypothetical protein
MFPFGNFDINGDKIVREQRGRICTRLVGGRYQRPALRSDLFLVGRLLDSADKFLLLSVPRKVNIIINTGVSIISTGK